MLLNVLRIAHQEDELVPAATVPPGGGQGGEAAGGRGLPRQAPGDRGRHQGHLQGEHHQT